MGRGDCPFFSSIRQQFPILVSPQPTLKNFDFLSSDKLIVIIKSLHMKVQMEYHIDRSPPRGASSDGAGQGRRESLPASLLMVTGFPSCRSPVWCAVYLHGHGCVPDGGCHTGNERRGKDTLDFIATFYPFSFLMLCLFLQVPNAKTL